MSIRLRARAAGLMLSGLLALLVSVAGAQEEPAAVNDEVAPKWTVALPNTRCSWSASEHNCHPSSPGVGDLNGDGRLDIVAATNNGHVVAVANGAILWDRDVAGLFGMAANTQSFASSPAIADLDRDGAPEVVVATSMHGTVCQPGGVIVLDNRGQPRPGWPQLSDDDAGPIDDCPAPFISTPALGDLDGDGDLEIVIGGIDKRIYAFHHNGQRVAGFPPASALYPRFGWENLSNRLADSLWSSPSLADVNGDGRLDIFIGADEGNMDDSQPGDSGGWTCPYRLPGGWMEGYCGGSLYGLTGGGALLPGFPQYRLEIIQSTPALADVTGDGRPEIFVGTGTYYYNNSPDHPTYGQRLYAFDSVGRELPGWGGGQATGDLVPGSPAVGDIAGDAGPEIVVATLQGRLFAWHADGRLVNGFPMTPRSPFGDTDRQDVGKGVVLGDYDGDGKMEIFMTIGWSIGVIDGNGQMLTKTTSAGRPFYYAKGLLMNNPVLADVDGDGQLELIVHNSKLYVWDLPGGATRADWPMFKHDPARTGALSSAAKTATLTLSPEELEIGYAPSLTQQIRATLTLDVPATSYDWRVSSSDSNVTFPQASGTATGWTQVAVDVRVPDNLGLGHHPLGTITVEVTGHGTTIRDNEDSVDVSVQIVRGSARAKVPVIFAPRP
ncbi:MAG: VCBS repeat-containing protein [Candidatus Promineofilum sp.]|nr:VCBS repeat-containing protein [Promineifilum sp.]MCW5863580.1 VCBS repeat-containing protein [Anaerolineae bacterium]